MRAIVLSGFGGPRNSGDDYEIDVGKWFYRHLSENGAESENRANDTHALEERRLLNTALLGQSCHHNRHAID